MSTKEDTNDGDQMSQKGDQTKGNEQLLPKEDQIQLPLSNSAHDLIRLLLQYHDPNLCSWLDSKKVTPNLYVQDWFLSLYERSTSLELGDLIWDFKMQDPFFIFFALIVMVVNRSEDLKKSDIDQEAMLQILKTMPKTLEEDDFEDLFYLVSEHYINSTPRSIRSYKSLLFLDQAKSNDGDVDNCEETFVKQLDLSQYLSLPILPAEIFATEISYFLVDCRPAEQYNAGHLEKAFHLDCSLMLREPNSFETAVGVLLDIQRQVVGGQHMSFIGSGHEEDDQYLNMVIASFLQKHQTKYVSIVVGGFDLIHKYISNDDKLKDRLNELIVDHDPELCKVCYSSTPDRLARYMQRKRMQSSSSASFIASSLFASTANYLRGDKTALSKFAAQTKPQTSQLAQSGALMFDRFAKGFVNKSSEFKDRLVETLAANPLQAALTTNPNGQARGHVSHEDRLGPRYTGGSGSPNSDGSTVIDSSSEEPVQEVQLDSWVKDAEIFASYRCSQVKGSAKHPGYIAISKTHLWVLREIPHNKGFFSIAAKRPLDSIVKITSKRRQPDMIIFHYGKPGQPTQIPSQTDHLHIPQPYEVIRLIKREIVRILDQTPPETGNHGNPPRSEESLEDETKATTTTEEQNS